MQVKNFVCFRAHCKMGFSLKYTDRGNHQIKWNLQAIVGKCWCQIIRRRRKLVGPNEVEVTQLDGTKLCYSTKHILIATGGRAQRPNIPGQVGVLFFLDVSCSTHVKQLVLWSTFQESRNQWTVLLKKSGLMVETDQVIHCIWPEFAHSFAYFRLLELFVCWQGMDRRL